MIADLIEKYRDEIQDAADRGLVLDDLTIALAVGGVAALRRFRIGELGSIDDACAAWVDTVCEAAKSTTEETTNE